MEFGTDRAGNELSSWTLSDQSTIDLLPHGTAQVRVTVSVPPTASIGERYAVIWAQTASPPGQQHNVQMVNRVGVRLYVDVGPGGEAPSDFRITGLTATRTPDGQPELIAQVDNTGQRAVDLSGTLDLSDGPGALSAGPFRAETGTTLAPGDTAPVRVLLDRRLPNGPWKAHLTLVSGRTQQTATATVTFPEGAMAASPAPRGRSAAVVPFAWASGAVGFAVLLIVAARRRLSWR